MAVARHAFTSRVPGGSELTPAPWASEASVFTHTAGRGRHADPGRSAL
jgi:hypothetical protein